jgi:hypothetical protein
MDVAAATYALSGLGTPTLSFFLSAGLLPPFSHFSLPSYMGAGIYLEMSAEA